MKKVSIIDYQVGNLFSVTSAIQKIGLAVEVVQKPEDIKKSELILLPGVGDFSFASEVIKKNGIWDAVRQHNFLERPIVGICLGMQLLVSEGFENGRHEGFDFIKGASVALTPQPGISKIPRIGWHKVFIDSDSSKEMKLSEFDSKYMYFAHSFHVNLLENVELKLSSAHGRNTIISGFFKNNIAGVQFHPEKSGLLGINFLEKIFNSFTKKF
jgi:imidazole glycerol phosphate synthase glutamine amidotransferase subunit